MADQPLDYSPFAEPYDLLRCAGMLQPPTDPLPPGMRQAWDEGLAKRRMLPRGHVPAAPEEAAAPAAPIAPSVPTVVVTATGKAGGGGNA